MLSFKHKSDILPITIFLFLFILDLYMYILGITGVFLIFYVFFSITSKAFIGAWNHHHQHHQTFSIPIMNRLLEIIYGLQTGIVGYGWVLHHNLGHHAHYQDQSKDESAWMSPKGKKYNVIIYTGLVSITAYYRAFCVGFNHKKIQKSFIYMCIIQTVIILILVIIQPLQALAIFIVPMITSISIGVYTTYYHHSGLESEDPYQSSYNIISPWYNFLTGNLGFHTAHHLKGGMHWSKLPEFHKSIEHKIDKKYYKRTFLLWQSQKK